MQSRFLGLAGLTVLAGAVAVGAITLTAHAAGFHFAPSNVASKQAASAPAPARGAVCQDFIKNLAGAVKLTPDQLNAAVIAAADKTIDDLVANGSLTATRAAALKVEVAKRGASPGVCAGLTGLGRHGGGAARPGLRAVMDAAAGALGISSTDLQNDLRKGMTLHEIAASRGVSEAAFRAAVTSSLTADMDAAVKAGKMTQKQEDELLARLKSAPIPFWDRTVKPGAATTG